MNMRQMIVVLFVTENQKKNNRERIQILFFFNANKNRALIKALCSYQALSHPRKILIPGLNYKVIIMKKLIFENTLLSNFLRI